MTQLTRVIKPIRAEMLEIATVWRFAQVNWVEGEGDALVSRRMGLLSIGNSRRIIPAGTEAKRNDLDFIRNVQIFSRVAARFYSAKQVVSNLRSTLRIPKSCMRAANPSLLTRLRRRA